MERTFVMIKPDGVERGLVGEIIRRFENRGLKITALKMLTPSMQLAEQHYAVHKGKPFYEPLLEFITFGPVVAMVLEAENSVMLVRQMIGSVDPLKTSPGTIRGDLTTDTRKNLIHGSDSLETAEYEIALWFPELTRRGDTVTR